MASLHGQKKPAEIQTCFSLSTDSGQWPLGLRQTPSEATDTLGRSAGPRGTFGPNSAPGILSQYTTRVNKVSPTGMSDSSRPVKVNDIILVDVTVFWCCGKCRTVPPCYASLCCHVHHVDFLASESFSPDTKEHTLYFRTDDNHELSLTFITGRRGTLLLMHAAGHKNTIIRPISFYILLSHPFDNLQDLLSALLFICAIHTFLGAFCRKKQTKKTQFAINSRTPVRGGGK